MQSEKKLHNNVCHSDLNPAKPKKNHPVRITLNMSHVSSLELHKWNAKKGCFPLGCQISGEQCAEMGGFWPELPVLADGHHNQQVAQDAHEHDQWQEADESNRLHQAVAVVTERRHKLIQNQLIAWNEENTDKCHTLEGD